MRPAPTPGAAAFSRRRFLAAAGLLTLTAGCTATERKKPQVSTAQTDRMARQVTVQEGLVASFAAASAADPRLGAQVADLAGQARQQLDRLRAAAPSAARSSTPASTPASASGPAVPAPPPGADVRSWLRQQVAAAATSHADACLDQSGARAALLGSISAGLRGQDSRLA